MQFTCWKCAGVIEISSEGRVRSRDTCTHCDADLHCCRNCAFYDPAKHNQCAEPQAEWVRDKDAANYCDYFQPSQILPVRAERPVSKAEDAKKKFDSLFKM